MSKEKQRPQEKSVEHTEQPKSAHATPVVEKYVEKRKDKAEKQIEEEQHED
ncbi:hypothetical protein [Pedobacter frigiditerrae]|uniref:hypothetical protein n=1 Tax=Pedobacter frigiditerrae TaxID=2530452 RepID=UPI0013F144B0|nr:hypothetical protein [Pedobacter frigiditerrae]